MACRPGTAGMTAPRRAPGRTPRRDDRGAPSGGAILEPAGWRDEKTRPAQSRVHGGREGKGRQEPHHRQNHEHNRAVRPEAVGPVQECSKGEIVFPTHMGRPPRVPSTRSEQSACSICAAPSSPAPAEYGAASEGPEWPFPRAWCIRYSGSPARR